jgi:hypothetical protein
MGNDWRRANLVVDIGSVPGSKRLHHVVEHLFTRDTAGKLGTRDQVVVQVQNIASFTFKALDVFVA